MDVYLSELVGYLARQSWQIAALTLGVSIVTWVLRHRTAHVRYLLWLIVLVKCLVPPFHAVPLRVLPERAMAVVPRVMISEPAPIDVGTVDNTAETRVSGTGADTSTGVSGFWVAIAWLVGASAYLMLNLLRAVRGQWWLVRTRRQAPDELMREMEAVPARGQGGAGDHAS